MKDDNIMKYETVLPADFDGVFRFSNPDDEDFVGVWGSKEYLFPAQTTSPMVIPEHSPLEIQNIRKKFAKDLAVKMFYKSKAYKVMAGQEGKPGNRTMNSIHQAATYTDVELTPYIQQCLKPLTVSQLRSKPIEKEPLENKLSRNDSGEINTEAIDSKTSLVQKAKLNG